MDSLEEAIANYLRSTGFGGVEVTKSYGRRVVVAERGRMPFIIVCCIVFRSNDGEWQWETSFVFRNSPLSSVCGQIEDKWEVKGKTAEEFSQALSKWRKSAWRKYKKMVDEAMKLGLATLSEVKVERVLELSAKGTDNG